MKVTLIDYSGSGWPDPADRAATVLIFTKQTRLTMSPGLLAEIAAWPRERKLKELEYMANTIPSSQEFCDYTFMIEGVTRAFTHQFVRSRHCSFAQQTMRVLDVSEGPGWTYATGPSIAKRTDGDKLCNSMYSHAMDGIAETYKGLIEHGAAIEDARGILPTNILTNIVMKCNMRTFVELVRKRSSPRTQGEYRDVLEAMKAKALAVHPWLSMFIDRTFERAAKDLDKILEGWRIEGRVSKDDATFAQKLIDQMRGQS